MNTIGIITIHKIHNYGSVLQAYALQRVCKELGYRADIIDYCFPNSFQESNRYQAINDNQSNEPKWVKSLFGLSLWRQHKGIDTFVKNQLQLSQRQYMSPDELEFAPPHYDIYLTGSDQVWSPRHTNGDPSFLLHFAPEDKKRIAYAASIGSSCIPEELQNLYLNLLGKYNHIGVREKTGKDIIRDLTGKDATVVLDPTLLLDGKQWDEIATNKRQIKRKYILCYFLNYSFNAFPYVEELAKEIQKQTGYEIVRVARPPHHLGEPHTHYRVGASPEEFLALIRDSEMVLTTSFHGTAFAVNYGKPVLTVVKDRNAGDSRQVSLMQSLGLDGQIVTIQDPLPYASQARYDVEREQYILSELRDASLNYLKNALNNE